MIVKQASILYDRTQHATILGGLILLGKTTCYCCDTSLVLAHRPLIQIFIRTHVSQTSEFVELLDSQRRNPSIPRVSEGDKEKIKRKGKQRRYTELTF